MIGEKNCPVCGTSSDEKCAHLALAVEARHFVNMCIERCRGERQWQDLCAQRRRERGLGAEWSSEREDFMWLESAFCDRFLRNLNWFAGIDYEWRSGPDAAKGGYWVLLWSPYPERLWWDLLDELERQRMPAIITPPGKPRPVHRV